MSNRGEVWSRFCLSWALSDRKYNRDRKALLRCRSQMNTFKLNELLAYLLSSSSFFSSYYSFSHFFLLWIFLWVWNKGWIELKRLPLCLTVLPFNAGPLGIIVVECFPFFFAMLKSAEWTKSLPSGRAFISKTTNPLKLEPCHPLHQRINSCQNGANHRNLTFGSFFSQD